MTLDDHIGRLMTCGKAVGCKFEVSCFEVARYAHELRGAERLRAALARVEGVEIPDKGEPLHFPPTWEATR
jgi:hypothetical protein